MNFIQSFTIFHIFPSFQSETARNVQSNLFIDRDFFKSLSTEGLKFSRKKTAAHPLRQAAAFVTIFFLFIPVHATDLLPFQPLQLTAPSLECNKYILMQKYLWTIRPMHILLQSHPYPYKE